MHLYIDALLFLYLGSCYQKSANDKLFSKFKELKGHLFCSLKFNKVGVFFSNKVNNFFNKVGDFFMFTCVHFLSNLRLAMLFKS